MVLNATQREKPLTEMTKEELENFEVAKLLFNHYDEIEIIKEFGKDNFQVLYSQKTRSLITKTLNSGVEDYFPGTNEKKIRRALSAKEILENVNKRINEDKSGLYDEIGEIKKANLFFHLNKLEEAGFIEEVGVIKSGRRRTTYFGKSSIIYISLEMDDKPYYSLLESENFVGLISHLNPHKGEDEIKETINKIKSINQKDSRYYIDWVRDHEEELRKYQLDYIELLRMFSLMHRFTHESVEGFAEIAELLKVNVDMMTLTD